LVRPTLEKYMGVKNAKGNVSKRNISYNIINAIKGNNPRALKRPNKGKKHNSNTFKDKSNKIKKLALLNKCLNK